MTKLRKLKVYTTREVLTVLVDNNKKIYQWYYTCPKCAHSAKAIRFHCPLGHQNGWTIAICEEKGCRYQFVIIE